MRHVRLTDSDFSSAALSCAATSLSRCLLVRADSLGRCSGMDLSDSDISGISLSGGELRGAKVNLEQAAMLGQLLAGVAVKVKSSLNTE